MSIPTEPIGSIPRPAELIAAWADRQAGRMPIERFNQIAEGALRETIRRFEQTGSPVITDGEQTKSSFATYPLDGASGLAADGVVVPFEDGHTRQLPRLVDGPFRYATHASAYLAAAKRLTPLPVKQAVISASALSLLYPSVEIPGYPRETFLSDLVDEAAADIQQCLERGADSVQIDFTEGRLSLKLDPSGALLESFVALNNRVLDRFTPQERQRIGVHTCPGGDRDATHSAAIDYAGLLPALFRLRAGRFYVQLASEKDPKRGSEALRRCRLDSAPLLFVMQRMQRIDAGRPERRYVARDERDACENRHRDARGDVGRRHAEQHRGHESLQRERRGQTGRWRTRSAARTPPQP
jgi:5-methyltetrahydropteroyltriglutamate--homocysteine methyltransferase